MRGIKPSGVRDPLVRIARFPGRWLAGPIDGDGMTLREKRSGAADMGETARRPRGSGRLIAVANMRGGVGKTTTVVMLTEALAADGASVMVVDLDPQASVSLCLVGETVLAKMIARGRTLEAYLALKLVSRDKPLLTPRIRNQMSVTMHQNQPLALARLQAEANAEDAGFRLFATRIPQAAALAEALMPRRDPPTFSGKYGAHVSTILISLIAEVKGVSDGA